MVKICLSKYPAESESAHVEHFGKYPYPLSAFQKYAVEAIVGGHHVLVTAPTGSGKTLPAEFAIEYFAARGKKVIYTSPIKALSNQKYFEFRLKFPGISFGILTGDIKANPEADVLIMTTEILQNTLYRKKQSLSSTASSMASFEMDLETELGAVVFDEVHYINDPDRGKVWEETILMLPRHVQMVMLSATLDAPEKFALWCETRGEASGQGESDKIVYLASESVRAVPLTHYSFITTNEAIFKIITDKEEQRKIRDTMNRPLLLQTAAGVFDDVQYYKMTKILALLQQKRVFVKRSHIINQACKYLVEKEMLPAICFVLSRKQLEICAHEVTIPLLEFDSKVAYVARHECDQIIRRLPNHEEYASLPEYNRLVSLVEKGIGIHHAGMMPILREVVELLFSKGFIKLLFATETFAVGINMPTKTVIFTDVNKFDGGGSRILHPHEYTQMAGRAGRRGIDVIGNVIHLNNLFRNVELPEYRRMMSGRPQKLTSKFKVSFNLVLNLLMTGDQEFLKFAQSSMVQTDIENELNQLAHEISSKEAQIVAIEETVSKLQTPVEVIQSYIKCRDARGSAVNKARRELDRKVATIKEENKSIDVDVRFVEKYNEAVVELAELNRQRDATQGYLDTNLSAILKCLVKDDFIVQDEDCGDAYILTDKGAIATHLREVHCLVFATMLEDGTLGDLDAIHLVGLFSCFTNVSVPDELSGLSERDTSESLRRALVRVTNLYDSYQKYELANMLSTGIDYSMHEHLVNYVIEWCEAGCAAECKFILEKVEREKGIFLGEFVKAVLKISNIASEFERIAEMRGDMVLLSKMKEIPPMIQKFVATNQSLYV
jgi:superfamily II RNA helicase